jgi:hypothetical protein
MERKNKNTFAIGCILALPFTAHPSYAATTAIILQMQGAVIP